MTTNPPDARHNSEDVAEAVAGALIAACGHVLILRGHGNQYDPEADPAPPVSIHDAHRVALNMLDRVIVRTMAEGAGPGGTE